MTRSPFTLVRALVTSLTLFGMGTARLYSQPASTSSPTEQVKLTQYPELHEARRLLEKG